MCGFRSRYSTQHAILNLLSKWQTCLDKSGVVGTILMDLSKAFDCLPHDLILAKLHAYGVDANSLKLLQSYLSNRHQRIKLESTFSSWLQILIGVPQGSILGPLLFNIFLNDILFLNLNSKICNFADDNTIYSCASSTNEVIQNLQDDLKVVLSWFKENQMMANPGKFQFMLLGKHHPSQINIEDKILQPSNSVKLLGLTIDKNLKFDEHCESICKTANAKIKCLRRLRSSLNIDQAKLLYNSFIFPQFNYCSIIWMFCSKKANAAIDKIQKRALRIVYNEPHMSLQQLIEKDKGMSIHTKNIITLLTEIYKPDKGENPSFMSDVFIKKDVNYSLRMSNLLTLPSTKTVRYGLNTFSFRASILWNSLPDIFKKSSTSKIFKKSLKENWRGLKCTCHICKS